MTLMELAESQEEQTRINIQDSYDDFRTIFDGSIGQLKKSKFCSGDFRTSRASHIILDWYADVAGKLQVTL